VIIIRDYVLPKIFKNIGFEEKEVIFNDTMIKYIIIKYVEEEEGIRNSKICFETLLMKLNLFRLLKKNDTMMQNDMIKNMEFPVTITEEIVDALF
jgi:ATP-dependent Lon protease